MTSRLASKCVQTQASSAFYNSSSEVGKVEESDGQQLHHVFIFLELLGREDHVCCALRQTEFTLEFGKQLFSYLEAAVDEDPGNNFPCTRQHGDIAAVPIAKLVSILADRHDYGTIIPNTSGKTTRLWTHHQSSSTIGS